VKRNLVVLLAVAVAVAIMLGFAKRHPRSASAGSLAPGASSARGKSAPDFKLVDIRTGKNVQLSDFKGKAVLLNFWATWCPPCKAEIPALVDLQNKYGPQGLQIIGVAMDDAGKAVISKFVDEMGVNYLVLQGTEKVGEQYGGVEGLPQTFYVGRDGMIVDHVIGGVTHRDAEEAIKQALNPGTSRASARGTDAPDGVQTMSAEIASGSRR